MSHLNTILNGVQTTGSLSNYNSSMFPGANQIPGQEASINAQYNNTVLVKGGYISKSTSKRSKKLDLSNNTKSYRPRRSTSRTRTKRSMSRTQHGGKRNKHKGKKSKSKSCGCKKQ